jgi:hypothetical protein
MRFTRPVCPAEDVGKDQARTTRVIARARSRASAAGPYSFNGLIEPLTMTSVRSSGMLSF